MPGVEAPAEIDLAGTWRIVSGDGKYKADYVVPGDVHSSLIAAGVIPDPYVGRNEYDVRWVAGQEWVASRKFQWDGGAGPWLLDVDYLDTVAEVRVNGKKVLSAENCFRRYRPDVTKALKRGENKIEIRFLSNVTEAAKRQRQQPYHVPYSANNCPIADGNMLRKPACHYGWDWNLAIAPFGAYGRIVLRTASGPRIEHITTRQTHAKGGVSVEVLVTLRASQTSRVPLTVFMDGVAHQEHVEAHKGESQHRFTFTISKPTLWWPVGSGGQHLYDLRVECGGAIETRKIGLRQIDVITTPDKVGARFAFKVNGKEIFCRGANWIPADALPSRATPALTRKLLQAAVDANMNMIRVWGGGYYEQDWFYDLCDELGLMVWQDFQFACNLYPATEEFLQEVALEVEYQVHRLEHHASIALWCGDNELIGALTWFEESRKNRDRYLVAYDRLNRNIEEVAKRADPSINWWPSSPSPGLMNFGDAWHDDRSGDMHFWSVWHEGKNFEHYRDVSPRFCSEFGFQSYPSLHIVKKFATSPDDLNIASAVMESHQKNAGGNARIAETMFRYFRFPSDFGNFCYLSQVQQGLAIKTAVEYWRSLKPHCMGTLYWQLNDTWPVASWASLDHGGGWKAMHYMARRFFLPVAVMAVPDKASGGVVVKAVNDRLEKQKLSLDLIVLDPAGRAKPLKTISATLPPDKAVDLVKLKKGELPAGHILIMDFEAADGSRGRVHFANEPYKALAIVDPGLDHQTKIKEASLVITLKAKHAALFVVAETGIDGRYSDNVIDLLPGEKAEIIFTPDDPGQLQAAHDGLIIRNLYSSSR